MIFVMEMKNSRVLQLFICRCQNLCNNINIFNKVIYSVLAHRQYIMIHILVLAICFGFYQPLSGL